MTDSIVMWMKTAQRSNESLSTPRSQGPDLRRATQAEDVSGCPHDERDAP
jgi:hypothetical protein